MSLLYKIKNCYWFCFSTLICTPSAWADLPTPPSNLVPTGDQSWLDVSAALFFKLLGYALVLAGAAGCIATIGGIIKAFQTAQKEDDMGYFFKYGFMNLVGLVLCLALAYAGKQILPSS